MSEQKMRSIPSHGKCVVLVTHENDGREFCKINYATGIIDGSIGYNAVGGDIEKARKALYTHNKGNRDE